MPSSAAFALALEVLPGGLGGKYNLPHQVWQVVGFAAASALRSNSSMFDPMYAAVLVTQDIAYQPCDYICPRLLSSPRRDSELGCSVAILEKAVSQQKCLVGLISRQPSGILLPWQKKQPYCQETTSVALGQLKRLWTIYARKLH
jgi:hypothetical protein